MFVQQKVSEARVLIYNEIKSSLPSSFFFEWPSAYPRGGVQGKHCISMDVPVQIEPSSLCQL